MDEEKNINLRIIPPNFAKAIVLAAVLFLVVLVVAGAVWINNTIKEGRYIGQDRQYKNTITISGEGKVLAVPDIGQVDLSVVSDAVTVAAAQKDNTDKMNKITQAMKNLGVEDKDLQTANYSIYPRYQYSAGKSTIIGYEVTQTLEVKIRNLDKAGDVLGQAAALGANQVGSLSFTFDDPTGLQSQARQKAIVDAKQKAQDLAVALGVTLGKITSFNESVSGMPRAYSMEAYGVGGGGAVSTPDIQTGQNEIQANVSLTYEIY